MDILRTLLVVGLVLLPWNARFRGVRPIRDFILWGILYPFHFALMGLLILSIWGLIGADYGLQGLFLVDNPWTQMLLGMMVMLLFAALIVHYSVLDTPKRWRDHSLSTLIRVLRDLNWAMPSAYPVQHFLRNGLLERFGRGDIEAIDEAIRHAPEEPATGPDPSAPSRAELEESSASMTAGGGSGRRSGTRSAWPTRIFTTSSIWVPTASPGSRNHSIERSSENSDIRGSR